MYMLFSKISVVCSDVKTRREQKHQMFAKMYILENLEIDLINFKNKHIIFNKTNL